MILNVFFLNYIFKCVNRILRYWYRDWRVFMNLYVKKNDGEESDEDQDKDEDEDGEEEEEILAAII